MVALMLNKNSHFRPTAKEILENDWILHRENLTDLKVEQEIKNDVGKIENLVKSTMILNRQISQEKVETRLVKQLQHWNSIDDEIQQKSTQNWMKRRPLRFSRTLDLESTVKFSSIDE